MNFFKTEKMKVEETKKPVVAEKDGPVKPTETVKEVKDADSLTFEG